MLQCCCNVAATGLLSCITIDFFFFRCGHHIGSFRTCVLCVVGMYGFFKALDQTRYVFRRRISIRISTKGKVDALIMSICLSCRRCLEPKAREYPSTILRLVPGHFMYPRSPIPS
ncbi:hypothetical protein GGR53DRAFT_473562 [Hypoxylon sp. FL1150]|nr:hypothetical protein GGR53DRAFT_473562 [Hypoxylon sp. FL1150]